MSEPSVIARREGRAGRLTLNRPKALHSLNHDMVEIMTENLLAWRGDPKIEMILVDHAPETRGFCAGGDVRMLAESGAKDGKEAAAFFAAEYRLNTLIKEYPKPYIAIIDGVTMGGGVGISVHGDYRIATPNTMFAMPESGIGLFPDVGGGWFLPRLPGATGMWLALTGERLKGEDVLAVGVATHFTDAGAGLADVLARDGLGALDKMKQAAEPSFAEHRGEIDTCFGKETVEDIVACLEAGSDWARAQAKILAAKSPLTLKIAHRQLNEGAGFKDFRDSMSMEYRIGARLVRTENFIEGVRAVLIDRDNSPNWQPPDLQSVTPEYLDTFFDELGPDELEFLPEE